MKKIELLAPAKDLACGIAAIDHGADAVYIGADRFGARVAAGNSVEDIAKLCQYAHQFGAKVYVTVNTLIYDEEQETTRQLLSQLNDIHVDAILVQDFSLLSMVKEYPSLTVHASTQTDNRSAEKVAWLRSLGFRRVVLARELSVEEICEIHRQVPDVELEVFVHGALCVSYSGVCYASQYCFKRSANRGACAQFCRLKFDLEDSDGRLIEQGRHLLSLKDMCQLDALEELMEAGAVSFKIEGRLKDVDYVKNVTAAYSQRLNQIISKHPDNYCRASSGQVTYFFTPNLQKTFNRGFTHYFLHGRTPDIFSPDTPKALGEYVGKVKEIRGNSFNVAGTASFANGDGLCFFKEGRVLEGFRVNRAEGNRLYPMKMPQNLRPGTSLYRNNDQEFERLMSGKTAERKIPVSLILAATEEGFEMTLEEKVNGGLRKVSIAVDAEKQEAEKPQRENIVRQLTKLGGTPYVCDQVTFIPDDFNYFIPSSLLGKWRRSLVEKASETVVGARIKEQGAGSEEHIISVESVTNVEHKVLPMMGHEKSFPYLFNIANCEARRFYESQGLNQPESAFELETRRKALLMQCRHCLRYSLGYCVKNGGKRPTWREPLFLKLSDNRRFRVEFQCDKCQMNIYAE